MFDQNSIFTLYVSNLSERIRFWGVTRDYELFLYEKTYQWKSTKDGLVRREIL